MLACITGIRETANHKTVNFSIVQATNISLVYTIDAYRPVAGEITVSQFAFKCESQLSPPPDFQISPFSPFLGAS